MLNKLVEREHAWHYAGGGRDLRLDLLRGFAALAMIADHIGGERSWLYAVTGGDRFVVSAAEAFVFISGAVMGFVYLNVVAKQGLAAALMKALHRAWTLYLVTIALTFSFAGVAYAFRLSWLPDVSNGGIGKYVLDVVTLHRTLYLTDIPLMYTLLLVIAGPVILLLSQGRWAFVLAASWLIWGAWQLSPESIALWQIEGNEVFHLPAWQVLFVTGMVIGWHKVAVEEWVRSLPRRLVAVSAGAVFAVVSGLYVAQLMDLTSLRGDPILYPLAFDKPDLPAGRLAVFALLSVAALAVTTEVWTPIRRATGWLLMPLGQNALTAYSVHLFVVALTTKLTQAWLADVASSQVVATALQAGGVLLVWLIVVAEPKLSQPFWNKAASCVQRCAVPLRYGAGARA